ncbi:MAG: hypothetical protein ACXW31_13065 [Thermoanaerobaculia bacterium]
MNRKIRNLMREIERRGGNVGLSESIPDEVAEQFLREILDCPDCRTAAEDEKTIDRILAGTAMPGRARSH